MVAICAYRSGAAAASCKVDEAASSEVTQVVEHILRRLVIASHGVGQTCVRVGTDEALGDVGQGFDVGSHGHRAQCTVEPDTQRLGVSHGDVESFGGLTGQSSAGGIGDGTYVM